MVIVQVNLSTRRHSSVFIVLKRIFGDHKVVEVFSWARYYFGRSIKAQQH